jgi:hypothetical protein
MTSIRVLSEPLLVDWSNVKDWAGILLPALTAIVGSTFGGWLGTQWALTSYRKTKAFDRQLEWYERMARMLQRIGVRLEMALSYLEKNETASAQSYFEELRDLTDVLSEVASERSLYAKEASYHAIGKLLQTTNHLGEQRSKESDEAADMRYFTDFLKELRITEHTLASELRGMLKWRKMPYEDES